MHDEIDELLQEIMVDANGDAEQLTSLKVAFEGAARFPFPARLLGQHVNVIQVEFEGNERRGLTALCRYGEEHHRVSLADLVPGAVTLETAQLLKVYRRWVGLPPLASPPATASPPARSKPWTYQVVASRRVKVTVPLGLNYEGIWDPEEQYWGEQGTDFDPVTSQIMAAGPRPEFEMEQVIPGEDRENWDDDPILHAVELRDEGYIRDATTLLKHLLAEDERCIDAWVHLGNFALDNHGPKAAFDLYDTAVSIGEQSLPEHFDGLLPRGLVDNRPFLRALHGLGRCAWRQRRWDDAESIFTNLAWLDGGTTWTATECLGAVRARQRWTKDG
jgi:hypothetical protein